MTARLCETVMAATMAELIAARAAAVDGDLVELRLDAVAVPDVAAALAGRTKPVIVTCRARWEGGHFAGTEEEREAILRQALALGAEFVDVEWRAGFDALVAEHGPRVVLSSHDFAGVPADLEARARAMRATGAGTIKIAVTPHCLSDTLMLRTIAAAGDAVVVGMGDAGMVTRLLPARFGSKWTYGGRRVAPGQVPVGRMVQEFRAREVGPDTRVLGVVSPNAMHSISPAMHNAALRDAGIDAVYVPLAAPDFDDFLTFAQAFGICGASVTIPFKLAALAAARAADERTRDIGAANTLRRDEGGWQATNTDVDGFLAPLNQALGTSLRGMRAVVLGAGGAARAVVAGLRDAGVRVTIHARREAQAAGVAQAMRVSAGAWPPPAGSWDLLVNTTPLGGTTLRDESPLPGGPFDGRLVYDLTYGEGESRLIREAREAGCRTIDGLPMLVAQAERQFEWWMGRAPGAGVMRAAAERRAGAAERAPSTGLRAS
jgi:3-dehydroquinate dehydratase/shikimate dehydrogenase